MKLWKRSLAALMCVVLTACAGSTAYQQAKDEEAVGHWDLAVMKYAKAVELDPTNTALQASRSRGRSCKASQVHFEKGKLYRASGRPGAAGRRARAGRPPRSHQRLRRDGAPQGAGGSGEGEAERAGETTHRRRSRRRRGARGRVTPMLEPASDRPINLNFPQPKPIKQIYQALADAAGINVDLRSAAEGRQRLDRPDQHRVPEARSRP